MKLHTMLCKESSSKVTNASMKRLHTMLCKETPPCSPLGGPSSQIDTTTQRTLAIKAMPVCREIGSGTVCYAKMCTVVASVRLSAPHNHRCLETGLGLTLVDGLPQATLKSVSQSLHNIEDGLKGFLGFKGKRAQG